MSETDKAARPTIKKAAPPAPVAAELELDTAESADSPPTSAMSNSDALHEATSQMATLEIDLSDILLSSAIVISRRTAVEIGRLLGQFSAVAALMARDAEE